ncbi:hypothetical protein [Dechloromonas sp. CZR5]|uniref:hypothetical protein n=1 Tax=Dechloromonas sp. CZR5 TaxID=2608630 RepID=UPI00168B27ED|nr:hypothetical protein [Dechloromonas sp. CZR5]
MPLPATAMPEQRPGGQGGNHRDEIEQPGHPADLAAPDQHIENADRADRDDDRHPPYRHEELTGPRDVPAFERRRTQTTGQRTAGALRRTAGKQGHVGTTRLLVQVAGRHAEQPDEGTGDRPAEGRIEYQPVPDDQKHAAQPEQQAQPLPCPHLLAEQRWRRHGDHNRMQGNDQR